MAKPIRRWLAPLLVARRSLDRHAAPSRGSLGVRRRPTGRRRADLPVRDAPADRLRRAGHLSDLPDEARSASTRPRRRGATPTDATDRRLPPPDAPRRHLAGAGQGRDGHGLHARLRGRSRRAGGERRAGPRRRSRCRTERQQLIGVTRGARRAARARASRSAPSAASPTIPTLYQAIIEYREALRARRADRRAARWPEAHEGADAIVRGARAEAAPAGPLRGADRATLAAAAATRRTCCCPATPPGSTPRSTSTRSASCVRVSGSTVTTPSLAGRTLRRHRSSAIDPILDPDDPHRCGCGRWSRRPTRGLRPESFVARRRSTCRSASRSPCRRTPCSTPASDQIVFVVRGEGRFEPRAVRLGREAGGYYEVLAGARRGRRGRHLGQLPHRLRVALPRRARGAQHAAPARRAPR